LRGAIAVAVLLFLHLAFAWVALTGWHKDNLAGPFLGILASLGLVLAVGVGGALDRGPRPPDQDEPPIGVDSDSIDD